MDHRRGKLTIFFNEFLVQSFDTTEINQAHGQIFIDNIIARVRVGMDTIEFVQAGKENLVQRFSHRVTLVLAWIGFYPLIQGKPGYKTFRQDGTRAVFNTASGMMTLAGFRFPLKKARLAASVS